MIRLYLNPAGFIRANIAEKGAAMAQTRILY